MQRWLPLLAFAALAALLLAGVMLARDPDREAISSPLIGNPAPTFALPAFHAPQRVVSNQDLRGTPYLLNVWGSWCPECRVEHPPIAALAKSGRVRVVGFNYKDERADAARWLSQFGDPFDLIIVDSDGRTAIDWGIYGAPETFLVDALGIVRWKHVGPLTPQIIDDELLPRLDALQGD